jgi:hypothetical protein
LWVEEEGKLEPVTMGSNPFAPTVPLVAFYSDRTGPMMARSPLEPVSDLSLEMLNVSSLLSMALGYCAIPQLVIHSRADMPNVGLGRSRAVALDQGDKAEYLFLPKQGVDALLETAGMLRRDIRDAIMRRIDLTRESAQRETAQAKAMDLSALHAFLCGVAKNMEEAEAKTWGLMCIGMGADPAKVSVSYNRRYDLRSASERLDEALKASALGLPSPTFRKEYTTALAKALLEDAAPEVVAQVVAELEQAEG